MSATTVRERREDRFAAYLQELANRDDRAALAALRRGLGRPPGEATEMYPYVVPWAPDGAGAWLSREETAYYLVAALFGFHPLHRPAPPDTRPERDNLGAALLALARDDQGHIDMDRLKSIERRFVALLNSHPDDLPTHLRGVIGLLRGKEIPVNYAQLLRDIIAWDRDDRRVQRTWARAFWSRTAGEQPADETTRTR